MVQHYEHFDFVLSIFSNPQLKECEKNSQYIYKHK